MVFFRKITSVISCNHVCWGCVGGSKQHVLQAVTDIVLRRMAASSKFGWGLASVFIQVLCRMNSDEPSSRRFCAVWIPIRLIAILPTRTSGVCSTRQTRPHVKQKRLENRQISNPTITSIQTYLANIKASGCVHAISGRHYSFSIQNNNPPVAPLVIQMHDLERRHAWKCICRSAGEHRSMRIDTLSRFVGVTADTKPMFSKGEYRLSKLSTNSSETRS